MVKLLAKLGRFKTVAIITFIAVLASIAVTSSVVVILNKFGFAIGYELAVIMAACVPLLVATPICWVLVSLIFRVYQVEESISKPVSYDSLTGLLSRQAFFNSASNYVSLATREKTVFSVMIIDLDQFRLINEKYGHSAGDAVLKLFANVVNSVARRSDITGRLGG